MIVVHIDGVRGDCQIPGYETPAGADPNNVKTTGWFVADSFTFGVQREMKESGEKSGTEDISISIGELQECNIGKSVDRGSPTLAQFAISGNALGTAIIDFVEIAHGDSMLDSTRMSEGKGPTQGKPYCYMRFKLDRCFVKSWTINGDADDRPTEEVAFYYNKIAFQYIFSKDGRTFEDAGRMEWDNVQNVLWTKHKLDLLRSNTGSSAIS